MCEEENDDIRIKEKAVNGNDLKSTVNGNDLKSTVKYGNDLKSTVKDGNDLKSTVKDGNDLKSTVKDGNDLKSTVKYGNDLKSTVKDGNDPYNYIIYERRLCNIFLLFSSMFCQLVLADTKDTQPCISDEIIIVPLPNIISQKAKMEWSIKFDCFSEERKGMRFPQFLMCIASDIAMDGTLTIRHKGLSAGNGTWKRVASLPISLGPKDMAVYGLTGISCNGCCYNATVSSNGMSINLPSLQKSGYLFIPEPPKKEAWGLIHGPGIHGIYGGVRRQVKRIKRIKKTEK